MTKKTWKDVKPMSVNGWMYIAIVGLIVLSGFFSACEIAYASVNGLRLKNKAQDSKKLSDRLAYYIYENNESALTTILIGNNLVNIASSSIATVIAIGLMGEEYAWVATFIMTVLILTFGEIIPKIVAKQISEIYTVLVSIPLRLLMLVTKPIVIVVLMIVRVVAKLWEKAKSSGPTVTEDDLENIIDTIEDEGVIDEERCDLLQSALDFDEILAYEILTPRVDVIAIDIDSDYEEIMYTVLNSPYSRIPVYKGTMDNVIGIIHLNPVFRELADGKKLDIQKILMEVHYIYKTMPLPDILEFMKKEKSHMVVVKDDYGGTMGILTMEDVLEQLVGEIWDESDEIIDELVKFSDTTYEADGGMRIADFFEAFDIDDSDFEGENVTLGGWIVEYLGHYPKFGEHFKYENLDIVIKKLHKNRIERVGIVVKEKEKVVEE